MEARTVVNTVRTRGLAERIGDLKEWYRYAALAILWRALEFAAKRRAVKDRFRSR